MSKEREISVKIDMIEKGIVPAFTGSELVALLNSLSDSERRKVKRKFRKIWKKLSKENGSLGEILATKKGSDPTSSQKRNRSVFVVRDFIKKYSNQ